jgi:hypothetical protein
LVLQETHPVQRGLVQASLQETLWVKSKVALGGYLDLVNFGKQTKPIFQVASVAWISAVIFWQFFSYVKAFAQPAANR